MMVDMKISGSSALPAGEYGEVKISGSSRIQGSVRCSEFSCSGAVHGEGDILSGGDVKVSGALKTNGSVSGREIKISGAMKITGGAKAAEGIKVSGALEAESVKARELKVSGVAKCGSIEAERAKVSGAIECLGLLNAEVLEIELGGIKNHIGSIGGGTVTVYATRLHRADRLPIFSSIAKALSHNLVVEDAIEADNIAVENTVAKRVSGRTVAIGAGCKIELLQYTDSYEIHPEAEVLTIQQI